jgi:putative peptidoglycan lipid II flippase
MLPAMLGTAVVQINLIVDSIVASLLAAGSISWLYYSDRLVEFPLGVFGIAIATVILPLLSSKFSQDDLSGFKNTLKNATQIALVFSLPAMFGLIVLSHYIILSLFQYGSFTASDTIMSSLSLIAYSIGLPAFILMKVLLTGFFSRQDTKTPVIYGIYAIAFNIIMNTSVVIYYSYNQFSGAHSLLALATSLSAWIQVILLYRNLRKNKIIESTIFFNNLSFKSLVSCLAMVSVLFLSLIGIEAWAAEEYYFRGLLLVGYIILGSIIYITSMYVLGYSFKKNSL